MALPPVIQSFAINAGAYLAGMDEMIAQTDQLAGSIDGTVPAAAAAQGAIDAQGAAYARAAESAGLLVDAQGRLRDANGRYASSAQVAAVEADAEAGGWDRSAAAAGRAGAAAEGAGTKTKAAGAEASGFGSAMKTAFLGVAVAAVYGMDQAAKYQSSTQRLVTSAGEVAGNLNLVRAGMLNMAGQVGVTAINLSKAMYYVESAGYHGAGGLKVLQAAAQGAKAEGADTTTVAKALTDVLVDYHKPASAAAAVTSQMIAAVSHGKTSLEDFSSSFASIVPQASATGISFASVSAALAEMTNHGFTAQRASTDLAHALGSLLSPTKPMQKAFAEFGVTSAGVKARLTGPDGLAGAMQYLSQAALQAGKEGTPAYTAALKQLMGSIPGLNSALATTGENFKGTQSAFKAASTATADGKGNVKGFADIQKTLGQQLAQTGAAAQSLAISFGTVLLPIATKVIGALAKFGVFLEAHPALAVFAGAILSIAAAFKVVAAAEAIFNAVTDANPVMLVIIAVIALAAGLYELYTHFKVVRDIVADVGHFFESAWKAAVQAAGAVTKWFVTGPLAFIRSEMAGFSRWWAANGAEVMQVWHAVWGVISAIAITYWRILSTAIRLGVSLFMDEWRVAWGVISDAFRLVWNVMAAAARVEIRIIGDIIAIFLDVVTGHWSKAWHDVRKLFSDAVHGVQSIASAFGSGLVRLFEDLGRNVVKGLINGIKSMFGAVGSVVSSLGSGIVSGFKSVLGIASPSKEFYTLGSMITQGLANGVNDSAQQAINASRKLATAIMAAASSGQINGPEEASLQARLSNSLASAERTIKARQASLAKTMAGIGLSLSDGILAGLEGATPAKVNSAVSKMLSMVKQAFNAGDITQGTATSLDRFLESDNTRLQALATRRETIAKTIAAAQKYAATTASNTEQAFGVMNAAGSTPMTAGDIVTSLRQDVSQITAFKNNIQKLAKMGLNKAYIDQLIQAGPVSGGQVAAELASGSWAQIRQVNSAEASIVSASTSLGRTAAEAMYDSGKQAGKGFLSGLEAQQKAIEKMMEKIAAAAINTMKRELKISSPSQVFMDHGRQVVAGFVLGLEGGTAQVGQAVKALAGAASMPHGGLSGIGAGGGGATFNVHLTVNGFVGSNQQLVQELGYELQHWFLQTAHRNPTNGLSLPSGR